MGEFRVRPGRPRRVPDTGTLAPRDQILDAAAALFVRHGFAGTSTRMIAERVGIRQASLYYHYAGKDDILADLLSSSVRPSLERIRELQETSAADGSVDGCAVLYAAVLIDVRTLSITPHNVGTLYLLPEVQHERFDAFRAEREELRAIYQQLGRAAIRSSGGPSDGGAGDALIDGLGNLHGDLLGDLLIQLAETVIQLRRVRDPRPSDAHGIATACLQICGVGPAAIDRARTDAATLVG